MNHTGVIISLEQDAFWIDEDDGAVHICTRITVERTVEVYLIVEEYTALGR